jgi:hypothetical protein
LPSFPHGAATSAPVTEKLIVGSTDTARFTW